MKQSLHILLQCINNIPQGLIKTNNTKFSFFNKLDLKRSMETVIHHFKLFTSYVYTTTGETYTAIEAPKGETGFYIVSNELNKPY